jgi:hypothetical protein
MSPDDHVLSSLATLPHQPSAAASAAVLKKLAGDPRLEAAMTDAAATGARVALDVIAKVAPQAKKTVHVVGQNLEEAVSQAAQSIADVIPGVDDAEGALQLAYALTEAAQAAATTGTGLAETAEDVMDTAGAASKSIDAAVTNVGNVVHDDVSTVSSSATDTFPASPLRPKDPKGSSGGIKPPAYTKTRRRGGRRGQSVGMSTKTRCRVGRRGQSVGGRKKRPTTRRSRASGASRRSCSRRRRRSRPTSLSRRRR